MKKAIISSLLLFPIFLFGQNEDCVINGKINKTITFTTIYLTSGMQTVDSSTIKNGVFVFNLKIKDPIEARIQSHTYIPNSKGYMVRTEAICYLVPGSIFITINELKDSSDFSFTVEGPETTTDYEVKLRKPITQYNSILAALRKKLTMRNEDTVLLKEQIAENVKKCFGVPKKYIREHLSSTLSIVALQMMGKGDPSIPDATPSNKTKDLQALFNSLSDKIKNSVTGKKYQEKLLKMI